MGKKEDVWLRQPGETVKAYEAFKVFLNADEHGIRQSTYGVSEYLGKALSQIKDWSAKYDWQERKREYDRFKAKDEFKKMQRRHLGIAAKAQRKALEALDAIDPKELTARDIRDLLKLGMEQERQNRVDEISEFEEEERENEPINIVIRKAERSDSIDGEDEDEDE